MQSSGRQCGSDNNPDKLRMSFSVVDWRKSRIETRTPGQPLTFAAKSGRANKAAQPGICLILHRRLPRSGHSWLIISSLDHGFERLRGPFFLSPLGPDHRVRFS
jgi:hypothetical protein